MGLRLAVSPVVPNYSNAELRRMCKSSVSRRSYLFQGKVGMWWSSPERMLETPLPARGLQSGTPLRVPSDWMMVRKTLSMPWLSFGP